MLLVTENKITIVVNSAIKPLLLAVEQDAFSTTCQFSLDLLAICIVVEYIQNIFTSSSESTLDSDEKDSSKSIVNNNVLTKF